LCKETNVQQPEVAKTVRKEPVKPKIPVAEKTPRQKRQAEKKPTPAPLPEEDKRLVMFLVSNPNPKHCREQANVFNVFYVM
jgi:hypothetical protein